MTRARAVQQIFRLRQVYAGSRRGRREIIARKLCRAVTQQIQRELRDEKRGTNRA